MWGNLSVLDIELSVEEREGLDHTLSNSGLCKALQAANIPCFGLQKKIIKTQTPNFELWQPQVVP